MTLIIVKNKEVLAMPNLFRYVLKFIYDEDNMSREDIRIMRQNIVDWKSAIDIEEEKLMHHQGTELRLFGKIITNTHKYSEEQFHLQNMAKMLVDNDNGVYDDEKKTYKEHGVDYRKVWQLPEAYELKDFIKGEEILEQHKKDNPEIYHDGDGDR